VSIGGRAVVSADLAPATAVGATSEVRTAHCSSTLTTDRIHCRLVGNRQLACARSAAGCHKTEGDAAAAAPGELIVAEDLSYLEGRKFCVVFVAQEDGGPIKMKCLHGRASIHRGMRLSVEGAMGKFDVPPTAYSMIMESDGTEMLRDAEYFVLCKVEGMEL
jgi:hypothetical protein